jgi:hypothetical protein
MRRADDVILNAPHMGAAQLVSHTRRYPGSATSKPRGHWDAPPPCPNWPNRASAAGAISAALTLLRPPSWAAVRLSEGGPPTPINGLPIFTLLTLLALPFAHRQMHFANPPTSLPATACPSQRFASHETPRPRDHRPLACQQQASSSPPCPRQSLLALAPLPPLLQSGSLHHTLPARKTPSPNPQKATPGQMLLDVWRKRTPSACIHPTGPPGEATIAPCGHRQPSHGSSC